MESFFRKKYFLCCFIILFFTGFNSDAQTFPDKDFHKSRREEIRKRLSRNTMAIVVSSPVRNRSNDVDFPYHQNTDFYYLTGFTEPNSILIIFKEPQHVNDLITDEILFVQEKNPSKELWTGKVLGTESAKTTLGFENVLPLKTFNSLTFQNEINHIFYSPEADIFENCYLENSTMSDAVTLIQKLIEGRKPAKEDYEKGLPKFSVIMASIREIKTPVELQLMEKAIDITCLAQIEVMKAVNPSMSEYHAQAILEYVFKAEGADDIAFPSIVGSGENTCTLHYTENKRKFVSGDLLLMDVGAEYKGYAADVTRTFPVNGKFSEEQKVIYQIVYDAQKAGFAACLPGNSFFQPGKDATKIISERLKQLGIIKKESEVRKYFMHGTSHYLGLDVHDVGTYGKLTAGQVITESREFTFRKVPLATKNGGILAFALKMMS